MSTKQKLPATLEPKPLEQTETPPSKETAPKETTVSATTPAPSPPKPSNDRVAKALAKPKPIRFIDLGAGYSVSANGGSGYYLLLRAMKRMCHFEQVVGILESIDPSNKEQAEKIVGKKDDPGSGLAMVWREELESEARSDGDWQSHAKSRIKSLKILAKASSKAAEATLGNKSRVKGNKWVGNVREMVSTCCSSYPEAKNRNTANKFSEVTFRQFPIRPRRGDKVFLMMYPRKYVKTIRSCIETAHGIPVRDQIREEKKEK